MKITENESDNQSLIERLYFGKASAESELKFLDRVFVPTSFFERTRRGQKLLVLGRKGTGKTALCLKLYNDLNQKKATVSLITPRNLSKFKISMLQKGSLNSSESSLLSWKYVFFAELGFYILDDDILCREGKRTLVTFATLPFQEFNHPEGFEGVSSQPFGPVEPMTVVGAF